MSSHAETKYTVNARIAALQTRVTELESAQRALRVTLLSELQVYIDAHCHGQNGKDGADGAPCQCREVKGDKGDKGDVTFIGPDEVAAEVKKVRAELLRFRAAAIGRILQGIADNKSGSGHSPLVRMHFEQLLRDISAL